MLLQDQLLMNWNRSWVLLAVVHIVILTADPSGQALWIGNNEACDAVAVAGVQLEAVSVVVAHTPVHGDARTCPVKRKQSRGNRCWLWKLLLLRGVAIFPLAPQKFHSW